MNQETILRLLDKHTHESEIDGEWPWLDRDAFAAEMLELVRSKIDEARASGIIRERRHQEDFLAGREVRG